MCTPLRETGLKARRRLVFVATGLAIAGCIASVVTQRFNELSDTLLGADFSDIQDKPGAVVQNITGTYDWVAENTAPTAYTMTGTIVLQQEGSRVRVTDTTHSNPSNRQLGGEARLSGNVLRIEMKPQNGDTDYIATVKMTFSDDGSRFIVDYSDTNGDSGRAHGRRRAP